MSIKKVLTTAFAMVAISSSISWGQTYNCSNGKSQQMGSEGGYDYELWSQDGAGNATMTLNPSTENGGAFSVEWSGTINMLARSGKRWGSNSTVTVQNVGNITSEFDVEWSSTDNVKYVSVYGWGYYDQQDIPSGFSNEIEYYIIQDRGSYNPTQGGKYFGSATIDGIDYDFYTTDRIQQPSLSGTSTFKQYWSIPKNTSQHRTKGTISISKHFSEWAKVGMKMGKLYEVASMKIESYTGNTGSARGSATVKKNLLKIGGSADELALNVTASPAAAGTVTKSPSANYYAPKTTVQLTAKANEGWKFVGWEGGVTGSSETISVTMDKDKSVVAKFELVGETTVNLLKDGDFSSGSVISTNNDASWFLGQGTNWGGSAAQTSVSGGTATVDVTTIGAENYQPQLVQY
ncbi:MAG: glycoside hydrolase family 11 protein, partial [Fibrobacteraceae bacterium]|nr:glycoside hydrolase family 11 protein [Fibrobacteraceae bacterium]